MRYEQYKSICCTLETNDPYRSENLSFKYEQLVLLPFGQHTRLTAVEQDWTDQGLVNGVFCLG
jgi:hypothetical protein